MDPIAIVGSLFVLIMIAGAIVLVVISTAASGGLFVAIATLFDREIRRVSAENASNDASPMLEMSSKLVAKRTHIWGRENTHTTYYATFEADNGSRTEFRIPVQEYGMLIEGDRGILRHQGTRYLGFIRDVLGN